MKVYVWKDEAYPVYGIDTKGNEVEIPDELYKRYQKITAEYKVMQKELSKYSCE